MKKSIIVVFLLLGIQFSYAQTNEKEAFQSFKQAREAYQNGNYSTSAPLLLKTKELLGSTNIRIQPMLIKSLVEIEDWRQAKVEVASYYGLNPDRELIEFQEIVSLENTINNEVYQEEQKFNDAKSERSVVQYQSYLNLYPYGKYRNEVRSLLSNQNEENAWGKAFKARSTSAYLEYLNKFPDGSNSAFAKSTIQRWDEAAYDKAIADDTQSSLRYYLSNYPGGNYRYQARGKLEEKKEYAMYNYATSNTAISNYEEYIRNYPSGKYADEANRVIESSYYRFGNDAYAAKKYSNAKQYYQTYLSKFPNGSHSSVAKKKINSAQRKLDQRGASFVMYTYDSQSPLGFSFGDLYKNSAGYYVNMKLNTGILTAYNSLWEIDNSGVSTDPWDISPTGEIREANIGASLGITFKMAYPLWGYLGGGASYYTIYHEVDEYYSDGDFNETIWMRNTDESRLGFVPEAGVLLKVSDLLVLKYGVMYSKGIFHQFGLGFQL